MSRFRAASFVLSLFLLLLSSACTHQTAFSDRTLASLWKGNPLSDDEIAKAKDKWPGDRTLIDMQQGMSILRKSELNEANQTRAHGYLESAYNTFEDLHDPENFSKAFTPDSKTPYRGRPYERMLTAIMLALLDASNQKCNLALPALRTAEFLDARWQSFSFGTDAPITYALMLRCLHQNQSSSSDIDRAVDGLTRALRMQLLLQPLQNKINSEAKSNGKAPEHAIAFTLLEVGIPTALLSADPKADLPTILETSVSESIRFLSRALEKKESPYDETLRPLLKKLGKGADTLIEKALRERTQHFLENASFKAELTEDLSQVYALVNQIHKAARAPQMVVYFDGEGPSLKRQGEYGEIAQIIPSSAENNRPGVPEKEFHLEPTCGVSNPKGALIFNLCKEPHDEWKLGQPRALKLWSSSFQATTTVGRKFDRILKGRADFRMGTEVTALVGGVVAMQLFDMSLRNRQHSQELQTAALVVGAASAAVWLAGRASNPEADIRQVLHNFESGYLLVP